jgi:hypothetical protein
MMPSLPVPTGARGCAEDSVYGTLGLVSSVTDQSKPFCSVY